MRWVCRVVIAVGVGVVVNVAVAWAFAWFVDPHLSRLNDSGMQRASKDDESVFTRRTGLGIEWIEWLEWKQVQWRPHPRRGVLVSSAPTWSAVAKRTNPAERFNRYELAAGLPMLSMRWCHRTSSGFPFEPAWSGQVVTFLVRGNWIDVRALPLVPMWPGFVVNTGVYGAVAMGVMVGPGWVVRGRRRRRGLCVGCGYPRGEGGVCPECGSEEVGASVQVE